MAAVSRRKKMSSWEMVRALSAGTGRAATDARYTLAAAAGRARRRRGGLAEEGRAWWERMRTPPNFVVDGVARPVGPTTLGRRGSDGGRAARRRTGQRKNKNAVKLAGRPARKIRLWTRALHQRTYTGRARQLRAATEPGRPPGRPCRPPNGEGDADDGRGSVSARDNGAAWRDPISQAWFRGS